MPWYSIWVNTLVIIIRITGMINYWDQSQISTGFSQYSFCWVQWNVNSATCSFTFLVLHWSILTCEASIVKITSLISVALWGVYNTIHYKTIVSWFLCAVCCVPCVVMYLSVRSTRVLWCFRKWRLYRQRQVGVEEALTGISILKPLVGVDPHLYENLETFFNLDYPLVSSTHCPVPTHLKVDDAIIYLEIW